jgi:hypothetical protein
VGGGRALGLLTQKNGADSETLLCLARNFLSAFLHFLKILKILCPANSDSAGRKKDHETRACFCVNKALGHTLPAASFGPAVPGKGPFCRSCPAAPGAAQVPGSGGF